MRVVEFFFQEFVWCGIMCHRGFISSIIKKLVMYRTDVRTDGSTDGFTNREAEVPILSGCNARGGFGVGMHIEINKIAVTTTSMCCRTRWERMTKSWKRSLNLVEDEREKKGRTSDRMRTRGTLK